VDYFLDNYLNAIGIALVIGALMLFNKRSKMAGKWLLKKVFFAFILFIVLTVVFSIMVAMAVL